MVPNLAESGAIDRWSSYWPIEERRGDDATGVDLWSALVRIRRFLDHGPGGYS